MSAGWGRAMLFNSLTFLYFLVLLVGVNALLPLRLRNGWIIAASCLFYMSWSPAFIVLLLITALFDYYAALRMSEARDQKDRRLWLVASLIFSLGNLAFWKYSVMFLGTAGDLSELLGLRWRPPLFELALPLGISFYTFETVSYAVDVYRGSLKPKRSFFEYLSFLMFFPKLIAGPIVRASELLPQIPAPRTCPTAAFQQALNLLMLGFTKKILLADNFAPFVERVFANPTEFNRWMCIAAVYGYSMQVYFDFSAYTDIARGCARLLGYELPENFNKPFLAVSISDFWRRWHMTLSRWLRDYFYLPLGGNRGTRLQTYRNLFLTMLVGGLWHGAAWTFVAWGALNGAFLVLERAWYDLRGVKPKRAEQMSWTEKLIRIVIVFHLITFTRIFFRSETFSKALDLIATILAPTSNIAHYEVAMFALPAVSIAYAVLSRVRNRWLGLEPIGWKLAVYSGVLTILLYFGASNAEFIYFQF